MERIVVKFGGSNLKRQEDFQKIIKVIKSYETPVVIVISAFYGITDLLTKVLANLNKILSLTEDLKNALQEIHNKIINQYIYNYDFSNMH